MERLSIHNNVVVKAYFKNEEMILAEQIGN